MKTRVRIGPCPLLCILQRRTFKEDIQAVEVRFGSKSDFATELADVGFTPKNGHSETIVTCPFRADFVAEVR